jgi:tetratricopeptide (TPR) repeat protein
MTLGSAPDCAIVLPDSEVAAHHASVEHKEDGVFVRDLGSMNRIVVNKREVKEARVRHGDVLELGRTRFLVRALVQAEVEESGLPCDDASRRWKRVLVPALAVAVLGVAWAIWPSAKTAEPVATPPAETAAVAEAPAPPPVGMDDIELLKKDISSLGNAVTELARRQTVPQSKPPTPAEAALLKAQALIARGDLEAADQWLSQIQTVAPDFLGAYEERAKLYELQGDRARASEQWAQIIYRSTETPLYQRAVTERLRLSEAAPHPKAGGGRLVRIASIEQNRFQATDDYDEMRTVTIHLAPAAPGASIDRDALRIDVTFYDRDSQLGAITPTAAVTPKDPLRPGTAWNQEGGKTVAATYLIPKGWREKEAAAGRACTYHGYTVRVFYNGALQDQTALPRTLLAMADKTGENKVSSLADGAEPEGNNNL